VKRTLKVFALIVFSLAVFMPFSLIQGAHAQNTNYTIQNVEHTVDVLYSGHIVISEKITLSGQMPDSFIVGFPYKYGAYVLKGTAFDSNFKNLPLTLGVQLQETGYYGASVSLPAGTSQVFTVVFTFSNGLLNPVTSGFTLDYPAYPSFVTTAASCSVTLNFPPDGFITGIDKSDGAINGSGYQKQNLEALSYSPAIAHFQIPAGGLQMVNIPSFNRQININSAGTVACTDTYRLVNNSTGVISFFAINLPPDAKNIVVRDELGRTLTVGYQPSTLTNRANVSLILTMDPGDSSQIILDYSLPSATPQQSGKFVLNLDVIPYLDYYVNSVSVTVVPPEGAKITSPQLSAVGSSSSLTRDVFQETLTVNKEGVSFVDSNILPADVLQVTYDYSPLWIAFRPTSWVWTIAIVGCVLAAIWTRPKTKAPTKLVAPKMTAGLTPEHIKTFTDAYEEKNKIMFEIRSLEARAQRGRMPRSRYKTQRRNLELRLNTLNQRIDEVKSIMRSAGGSYADTVRQLEFAEVTLNEVELEMSNADARHATGEMPIDEYRKQLADLERRKAKADNTINGLLLRLRGEIS
jgi:hypothetical protein